MAKIIDKNHEEFIRERIAIIKKFRLDYINKIKSIAVDIVHSAEHDYGAIGSIGAFVTAVSQYESSVKEIRALEELL